MSDADRRESDLRLAAWLWPETVDDMVNEKYGTFLLYAPLTEELKRSLIEDYARALRGLDIPEADRERIVAGYADYLAGPFPAPYVPVIAAPPSWDTVRELLHAVGEDRAVKWRNGWPEEEDDAVAA
jgi:hypothetical protein